MKLAQLSLQVHRWQVHGQVNFHLHYTLDGKLESQMNLQYPQMSEKLAIHR